VRRRRASISPASTAACLAPTARSAAPQVSRHLLRAAARPASSSCSAPTRRWRRRSPKGGVHDVPARRDARPASSIDGGRAASSVPRRADGDDRGRTSPTPVVPRPPGLRQRLLPVHERQGVQRRRDLARTSARAPPFANPCYTQIHPDLHPRGRGAISRS
jgi:hypothetical protein